MNNSNMCNWLTEQMQLCQQEEKRLAAEDRQDEAVLAKIRGNVFDIFRTVLTAGEKAVGEDQAGTFLREKLDTIPRSWQTALEKAQAYGEADKACIEKVKLEAAGEIYRTASNLWGWEA